MEIFRRLIRVMRAHAPVTTEEPLHGTGEGVDYDTSRPNEYRPPRPEVDPQLASYYANLELPYGAGREQVKAAWKRLLKKYHPDLHAADPEQRRIANELTAELTSAYKHLDSALEKTAV